MAGENTYPNADNYPVPSFTRPVPPPPVDPDEGDLIAVAYNPLWQPVLMAAVAQLLLPSTWQGDHDDIIEAQNRASNLQYLLTVPVAASGEYPTPYWDEATDVDDAEPADMQTWYGEVTDAEAPADDLTFVENAGIWIITGFIAYAGQVGGALFFRTIAPRFVLAWHKGDVREIWRIVVDASDAGTVDTDDYTEDDVIEVNVVGDPDLTEHDIYIIQTGL